MGWGSRVNTNPNKGKIKPRKSSKAEVDRKIIAILDEFIRKKIQTNYSERDDER